MNLLILVNLIIWVNLLILLILLNMMVLVLVLVGMLGLRACLLAQSRTCDEDDCGKSDYPEHSADSSESDDSGYSFGKCSKTPVTEKFR